MDNPDGDPPKRPRKTLNERRKEAKKAELQTRQLMREQALQRERELELAIEQERARELEEQQFEMRAEQEQQDHDVAMAISTDAMSCEEAITAGDNPLLLPIEPNTGQNQIDDEAAPTREFPLLLPAETGIEHRQIERQPISHVLECSCGGFFEGTRNLKSHVKENPSCFVFWGGSLESVSRNVQKEFKRRKSMRNYYENQGLVLERKRVAYNANREKERNRKRPKNETQAEKERERQSQIRAARVESQTSLTDCSAFEKEGRYGPIFPCVSCQQLNWYTSVSIEKLDELRQDFIDIEHVRANINLFQKQDRFFLCRACKTDLKAGRCPKMSTKNYLQCPWLDVPSHLLNLNEVENSLVAPVVLFAHLHGNVSGNIVQSKRITAIPVSEDFQRQVLGSLTNESMMAKIVRGNNFNRPVYKGDVRPEVIREIYQFLSGLGNADGYRRVPIADIAEYSMRQNQARDENFDEHNEHDLVIPENVFSPGQGNVPLWFFNLTSPYSKTMPIFFPRKTGDWDDPRRDPTRPISEGDWVRHILRSVHKQLTEFPLFPFTAAYRMDMKAIQSAFNSCTGYRQLADGTFERCEPDGQRLVGTVVGSSEWYAKQKCDIYAKCTDMYNPSLFVTLTNTDNWDVNLSTALSQDGWDIWHKNDEQRLLFPLEGLTHPVEDEGDYFAHVKTVRLVEDDCPYHEDCKRSPIQALLDDDTKKKLLSRNIYSNQRIFCQRTGSLLRHLIMSTSNRIEAISFHFLKEFGYEGGLAHSHGLVWQNASRGQHALLKMQNGMPLSESEMSDVCRMADSTVTASIDAANLTLDFPDLNGERIDAIVDLAKQVQMHICNRKCEMLNDTDGCLYHFPRLPSEFSLICSLVDSNMDENAAWYLQSQCRKVKMSVRTVLKKLKQEGQLHSTSLTDVLLQALGPVDDHLPDEEGRYSFKDGLFPACEQLARYMQRMQTSGHPFPAMYALYNTALSTSTWHVEGELVYQLILKRSVSETYTVDYNPYLLESMRSNMEVRYVTHTPNLLINYVTKAENKPSIENVLKDIQRTGGPITGANVASKVQDYRKISLPEAFFRIDTKLFFVNTNLQVVFVNTNFPHERGTMYKPSTEGHIQLPGRNGRFEVAHGILAKYAKRPKEPLGIKVLTAKQYSMCYKVPKGLPEIQAARDKLGRFSETMFAAVGGMNQNLTAAQRMLPLAFEATDGTLRVLRQKPVVVDTTSFPASKKHNHQYAEILMFRPWFDEIDELGLACRDMNTCSVMHLRYADEIASVKEKCKRMLLENM